MMKLQILGGELCGNMQNSDDAVQLSFSEVCSPQETQSY
jgi:hypothetical protein